MSGKINNLAVKQFSSETISAIFIIAFVSLFILANFAAGFILPLFILMMAVAAAIAFFYPRSGVAAIVFLTFIFERFFTLQPIVWGRAEYKLYPLDIILVAVLAGVAFYFFNKKGSVPLSHNGPNLPAGEAGRPNLERVDFYLITFIILAIIYFFASAFVLKTDFNLSFSSFKYYAFYPLLYFVVAYLFNSKEKILWLFKFALAGAIGIIFFIVYGLINGAGLWSEFTPLSTEGIRTLAFPHAFYLSLVLIGLTVCVSMGKNKTVTQYAGRDILLRHKNLYFALIIVWMIGIIGSMMRHLWIALFAALVFMFFIVAKKEKRNLLKISSQIILALTVILVLAVYLSFLFPNSVFRSASDSVGNIIGSRVGSLASTSADESFSWRSVAWKEAAREYLGSPIFGTGFGKKIYIEIEDYKDFVEIRNIHNSPLVVLVQMGLAGIVLLIISVWENTKKLIKKAGKDWLDVAILGIFVFYLVAFLFQPYLETNLLGMFFWMNLGIMRSLLTKLS